MQSFHYKLERMNTSYDHKKVCHEYSPDPRRAWIFGEFLFYHGYLYGVSLQSFHRVFPDGIGYGNILGKDKIACNEGG